MKATFFISIYMKSLFNLIDWNFSREVSIHYVTQIIEANSSAVDSDVETLTSIMSVCLQTGAAHRAFFVAARIRTADTRFLKPFNKQFDGAYLIFKQLVLVNI